MASDMIILEFCKQRANTQLHIQSQFSQLWVM